MIVKYVIWTVTQHYYFLVWAYKRKQIKIRKKDFINYYTIDIANIYEIQISLFFHSLDVTFCK